MTSRLDAIEQRYGATKGLWGRQAKEAFIAHARSDMLDLVAVARAAQAHFDDPETYCMSYTDARQRLEDALAPLLAEETA